jgi:hypothetical protein
MNLELKGDLAVEVDRFCVYIWGIEEEYENTLVLFIKRFQKYVWMYVFILVLL